MSVYSNERTILQPSFVLSADLVLNEPQQMDGLKLLEQLPDKSITLVFFDPQYRAILNKLNYGNEGARQKERSKLPQMDEQMIGCFIDEIERILVPSGHMMLWLDKFTLVAGAPKRDNLPVVDLITWNKGRIGMGYRTRRCSEYLMIYQRLPTRAKGVWISRNIPDDWIEKADKSHPHAKPAGLMKKLIEAVTNAGDVVVDPAAGGYNTMRAAAEAGRQFLGCDLLPATLKPRVIPETRTEE